VQIEGRGWLVHRAIYALMVHPIPVGAYVCHHCDVPACCNPEHLYVGDQKRNMGDAALRGRMACGPRHGVHTHPETHRHKLAPVQVAEIRDALADGMAARQLARQYGVHHKTILDIRHRRSWLCPPPEAT
jgi:hypothetical protein